MRKSLEKSARLWGVDFDEVLASYVAIPKNEAEIKFVERLTTEAVLKATERHAGYLRYIYGPSGRSTLAEGKEPYTG